jgi:hypothetical protein
VALCWLLDYSRILHVNLKFEAVTRRIIPNAAFPDGMLSTFILWLRILPAKQTQEEKKNPFGLLTASFLGYSRISL